MNTTTSMARAPALSPLDPAATHRHTSRCYWEHRRCAWTCTHTDSPIASAPDPATPVRRSGAVKRLR